MQKFIVSSAAVVADINVAVAAAAAAAPAITGAAWPCVCIWACNKVPRSPPEGAVVAVAVAVSVAVAAVVTVAAAIGFQETPLGAAAPALVVVGASWAAGDASMHMPDIREFGACRVGSLIAAVPKA